MKQKQRLYVYGQREMGVLILLGVMVAVFAFTLGVHLGKAVGVASVPLPEPKGVAGVTSSEETLPDRQELSEAGKSVNQTADQTLRESLRDEVSQSGLALNKPRPVELPTEAVSHNGGATTLKHAKEAESAEAEGPSTPTAGDADAAARFTLQVGSFPNAAEAQNRVLELEGVGLHPFLRQAQVKGHARFRVFLGNYGSRAAAEKAGDKYRDHKFIDSFIVGKVGP